jgi:hypothetical protein
MLRHLLLRFLLRPLFLLRLLRLLLALRQRHLHRLPERLRPLLLQLFRLSPYHPWQLKNWHLLNHPHYQRQHPQPHQLFLRLLHRQHLRLLHRLRPFQHLLPHYQ